MTTLILYLYILLAIYCKLYEEAFLRRLKEYILERNYILFKCADQIFLLMHHLKLQMWTVTFERNHISGNYGNLLFHNVYQNANATTCYPRFTLIASYNWQIKLSSMQLLHNSVFKLNLTLKYALLYDNFQWFILAYHCRYIASFKIVLIFSQCNFKWT